jgi:hypothetical protein
MEDEFVSWPKPWTDGKLRQDIYEPYHRIGYATRTVCGKHIPGTADYFPYATPLGRCSDCEAGTFHAPAEDRSYE